MGRQDDGREVDACLMPDEGEHFSRHRVHDQPGARRDRLYVADSVLEPIPDAAVAGERTAPWNAPHYLATLDELAAAFDKPLQVHAQR